MTGKAFGDFLFSIQKPFVRPLQVIYDPKRCGRRHGHLQLDHEIYITHISVPCLLVGKSKDPEDMDVENICPKGDIFKSEACMSCGSSNLFCKHDRSKFEQFNVSSTLLGKSKDPEDMDVENSCPKGKELLDYSSDSSLLEGHKLPSTNGMTSDDNFSSKAKEYKLCVSFDVLIPWTENTKKIHMLSKDKHNVTLKSGHKYDLTIVNKKGHDFPVELRPVINSTLEYSVSRKTLKNNCKFLGHNGVWHDLPYGDDLPLLKAPPTPRRQRNAKNKPPAPASSPKER
eukprot:g32932.t1